MKTYCVKKGLAVGIILLFIGVAIVPGITAVISLSDGTSTKISDFESVNDDLVEIKVKTFGINSIATHTVWLTEEQVIEYDNLINNFKIELDNCRTLEETIVAYNDMGESLYELGLMPNDLDVKEAKQLVTGAEYSLENLDLSRRRMDDEEEQELASNNMQETMTEENSASDVISNRFCLISGESQYSYAVPIGAMICNRIMQVLYDLFIVFLPKLSPESGLVWLVLWAIFIMPFYVMSDYLIYYATANRSILAACGLSYGVEEQENVFVPSVGWVHTIGLFGKKELNGTLYGFLGWQILFVYRIHVGVKGFTGIWTFNVETEEAFYLGFARKVKIGSSPPYSS